MIGLAVSVLALVVIFLFVDLRQVANELAAADKGLLAISGLSTLVWLAVRMAAWRSLLQGKVGAGTIFFTLSEGYLLNNILPFRLGEVARAFLLSRKTPVRFMEVLTTILLERAFDVLFAASLVVAILPFLAGAEISLGATIVGGSVVLVGLAVLYGMARFPGAVYRWFHRLSARLPILQRVGQRFLPSFLDGLAILKDPGMFFRTVAWFLLNLIVGVIQYFTVVRAFYPDAQPVWAMFTLGVSSIGWALPSSPGGIGVYEAAVVVALSAFSPDANKAFACGVVIHFWNYFLYHDHRGLRPGARWPIIGRVVCAPPPGAARTELAGAWCKAPCRSVGGA